MPNFDNYKTSNLAYFTRPQPGKPSLKLDQPSNWVDDIVDQVAAIHRAVLPADQVTSAPAAITVGPSPFTYIAGTESEQVFIAGLATAVERWNEETLAWVAITSALPITVMLPPSGQLRVSYPGAAPGMIKDVGNFNNAAGITEELTPDVSPWTIQAEGRAIVLYISGGAVTSVKRNGVSVATQLPCVVVVPRGGSAVIAYNVTPPLVVKDS